MTHIHLQDGNDLEFRIGSRECKVRGLTHCFVTHWKNSELHV